MKTRWLAAVVIFALGFCCSQVMKISTADAQDNGGMLDDGLLLIEHEDFYELIDTGEETYVAFVERKPGTGIEEPEIVVETGSAVISKEGLDKITLARLLPLETVSRECNPIFEDCPAPRPLPGPRPPITDSTLFLEPGLIPY